MPHKRFSISLQSQQAARIVSLAAVKDPSTRESVNILTLGRIALILQDHFGRSN